MPCHDGWASSDQPGWLVRCYFRPSGLIGEFELVGTVPEALILPHVLGILKGPRPTELVLACLVLFAVHEGYLNCLANSIRIAILRTAVYNG